MTALREGTRDLHDQIDLNLSQGDWFKSRAAYGEFLQRSLGFHRIVESVIAPYAGELTTKGWEWRPRSPLLEADLLHVEGADARGSHAQRRSGALVVGGLAGVIGSLYVLEGSTLGGRVIASSIRAQLGYDAAFGASSFVPHGAATDKRWNAFGGLAERCARVVPGGSAAMVIAARATFELHALMIVGAVLAVPETPETWERPPGTVGA